MPDERPFLPYGRHCIEDDDIDSVVSVLRSEFLTSGPVVEEFESELARVTGATHAIAVSSGSSALHLAALVLDLVPGNEVIVPSTTFLSTANAARYVGAEVVFADVDPENGLITPNTLVQALERSQGRVRAVFAVHLNGQLANMQAISQVPGIKNVSLVEDACHALGGSFMESNGKQIPVGSNVYSKLSTFSFHPVKTVAMGEGGAVTTNDHRIAQRLRSLRNIGMTRTSSSFQDASQAFDAAGEPNPWYYEMTELGYNFRASALHCGLGLSQLKKLSRFVEKRNALMAYYKTRLGALSPIVKPINQTLNCSPSWHLCPVLIDFEALGIPRASVMRNLYRRGIGSQVHYIPVHRQPYYREICGDLTLPGADAYYNRILSLPLSVHMDREDVDFVIDALQAIIGGRE